MAEPVSLLVQTFGTGALPEARISEIVRANFDARPGALIRQLDLRRPIFRKTAAYGHFGRNDADFTWEKTDKAAALKDAARRGAAPAKGKAAPKRKAAKNGTAVEA